MSEWKEVKFANLCDITRGASPRPIKDFIADEGMPWVKIADATKSDSRFIERTKEKIKLEGVDKSKSVYPGDLILSNSATPGLPKFMKIQACVHDGWMLLRNFKGLNKRFAYWLLLHERKNLVIQGNGSVFTNLKTDILKSHVVSIPEEVEQESIANILDSIQDKIELNRQTNQTLVHISQAIFKSWFVDFEPTRAKIKAKKHWQAMQQNIKASSASDYAEPSDKQHQHTTSLQEAMNREAMAAISGKTEAELNNLPADTLQQLSTTAELFPDTLVESELGEIPAGWSFQDAIDVADVAIGKTPPRKESQWFSEKPTDIRWVSIKDMGKSGTYIQNTNEYLTKEAVNKFNVRLIPDNTVILSFKMTVGRVAITDGEMLSNEAIAHFKLGREVGLSTEYLYLYFTSFDFESMGSTSSIVTAVNSKMIKKIPILVPSCEMLDNFKNSIAPIFKEIKVLLSETSDLISIRDTLLPKLLSGELILDKNHAKNGEVI